MLVLLNGPPAVGKSTIAERLVGVRPLALRLDVDVVRGLLGGWLDQPTDAGLAARALAVAMAREHLAAGHDVFVPQFLGRADFIVQLERLADDVGVPFVEIALVLDRESAIAAFEERRSVGTDATHRDAEALVDRSGDADAVAQMFDRYEALLGDRPSARRVHVVPGDIERTAARVESAVRAGVELRPGDPADAEVVAAYHHRCWLTAFAPLLELGVVEAMDPRGKIDRLRAWLDGEGGMTTVVAVLDGRPVGHTAIDGAEVVHVFVDPDHHGRGIGRALLADAEAIIRNDGHTDAELHTIVGNAPAITLYESAGWSVTDELVHTDQDGVRYSEHVLRKRLSPR